MTRILLAALVLAGPGPLGAQGNAAAALERVLQVEDRRAARPGDVDYLVRSLSHPAKEVILRAARALGRLERPALGARLLPLLRRDDPGLRSVAVEGIAQALQGFRGDSSPENRTPVWGKLTVELLERLRGDGNVAVQAMAALSLGRLPYVAPGEIAEVRRELISRCSGIRGPGPALERFCRGAETLTRTTWRRVPLSGAEIGWFRSVLSERAASPESRRHALGALLAGQAADDDALSTAVAAEDAELRRLALTGLRHQLPGGAGHPLLAQGLADADFAVRLEAVRALPRTGGCAGLRAMVGDRNPQVGIAALDALASCPPSALPWDSLLSDLDTHRGRHALVTLARTDSSLVRRHLLRGAGSSSWLTRIYAARAAAAARDTSLLRKLAADPDPNVAEAALTGLTGVLGHGGDAAYRSALASGDYQLLRSASLALQGTPDPRPARVALLGALRRVSGDRSETSRDARVELLHRLGELGDTSLAADLAPFLRDFDPVVAESAAVILSRHGRRKFLTAPRPLPERAVSWRAAQALADTRLVFEMASGARFIAELYPEEAPVTVAEVVRLARSGYYDGRTFHRLSQNFVIQGGSPGANEYTGHPRFLRDELSSRSHARGTLGISTRGRDTGDGQIFVNLRDNPRLDYDYTVFGRVVDGLDAVDAVLEGDVIRRVEVRQSPPIASADTAALMATVRALAADSMEGRRVGTPGGARARRYLLGRLSALSLAPWQGRFEHGFTFGRDSTRGVNLLAAIPGTRNDLPWIVLSAHYDHEGIRNGAIYNGADDNASGVAAVLAIAASLKRRPLAHPVLIALFDAEEGGLRGARALVADPAFPKSRVALDVNLDMVSHSEPGILWAVGAAHTPALRPMLEEVASRAGITLRLGHDRKGVAGEQDWTSSSDHGPFHAAGIPFLYFGVEDHVDYHKPTDDPGTVTVPFFGKAVGVIEAVLRMVDGARLP